MNGHYPPGQGNYGPRNQHPHQGFVPHTGGGTHSLFPPVGSPPPRPFPAPETPPRKKRHRVLKVTLTLVVVAVLAFAGTAVVRSWMSPSAKDKTPGSADLGSGSVTDPVMYGINIPAGESRQYPSSLPGVPDGTELSGQQLGGVDPRVLLWVTLKRQAARPVTDVVNRWYQSTQEYDTSYPAAHSVIRSVIDWRTREFTRDDTSIDVNNAIDTYVFLRCVGPASGPAREGTYSGSRSTDRPATWKIEENPRASNCPDRMKPGKLVANNHVTDGLAPSGLSGQAMDKFISYLDHVPNLIQVARPESITGKNGKTYIQLDVTLVPQPDGTDTDSTRGAAFLNAAFAQTGKSPYDQPYSINIGAGQGFKKRYFLDPATLLPAYSVTLSTPQLHSNGTPITTGPQPEIAYSLDQHSWPEMIDPDAKRTEGGPPVMPHRPWPFDKIRLH
ncbi:hypothetical protein CFP71_40750 [Amycolatopsis thailandensis]|uniref:Uncharacterized protein n=1 Tax=Amycolatopsis thailandensis TaxID=589330 RepID=A0A229RCH2_9PSEU|nr:hypothetical protein [Amycolatopsis thailandensis]OXM44285.1 hypothetical protein CFP71_40750 [Amycolatopsis thailandensis]